MKIKKLVSESKIPALLTFLLVISALFYWSEPVANYVKDNTLAAIVSGKTKCNCPYSIIYVGGITSKDGDSVNKWAKDGTRNMGVAAENMYKERKSSYAGFVALGNDGVNPESIAKLANLVSKERANGKKVLIVGYSLGGVIAQDFVENLKDPCVEVIPVDPPTWSAIAKNNSVVDNLFGRFMASTFSKNAKMIQDAEKAILANKDYINWTNGEATEPLHTPFDKNTEDSFDQLSMIEVKINGKMRSCSNIDSTTFILSVYVYGNGGAVYPDAVAGAKVQITDRNSGKVVANLTTNSNGRTDVILKRLYKYRVMASKNGWKNPDTQAIYTDSSITSVYFLLEKDNPKETPTPTPPRLIHQRQPTLRPRPTPRPQPVGKCYSI